MVDGSELKLREGTQPDEIHTAELILNLEPSG